jgi:DNA-directed RNA polymerase specialized sigma24 family protein
MTTQNEDAILQELKEIKKLLALSLVSSEADESKKILILNRYGFRSKDISEMLQINPSTVGTTLFRARQSTEKKK